MKRYSFWRAVIIIASAVPIAILTNAMRVSGTGVLAHYYGTEVADGFFHSFSGWVVYIVAFLLLFMVAYLLDRFGHFDRGDGGQSRDGAAAQEVKAEGVAGVGSAQAAREVVSAKGAD